MNQTSAIIVRNDALVSEFVKKRDPFCVARLPICQGQTVDPMHVYARKEMGTRWTPKAVFGGCRACHSYLDTHTLEKEESFRRLLGADYGYYKQKAQQNCKYLPAELKEINKNLKCLSST